MRKTNYDHFVSPLRYPGGKACIYRFVTDLFYNNSLIGIDYAEPYAGGAGLALRLLADEFVNKIYINDLDPAIYAFWYAVKHHSVQLCDWIEDLKIDIESWREYKHINCNLSSSQYSLLDIGKSTFFLNRTNVSGIIQGGVIGGSEQKGKYKIDARFNKTNLISRIERIANLSDRIKISRLDGVKFIKRIRKLPQNCFIYLDPPYVEKGADLYMNFFIEKDHKRLAKYVKKIDKYWMVSYDNNQFISELYKSFDQVSYNLSQSASNRVGKEIIIFNDAIDYNESLSQLRSVEIINKCA
jgi:DNA adenine methylase